MLSPAVLDAFWYFIATDWTIVEIFIYNLNSIFIFGFALWNHCFYDAAQRSGIADVVCIFGCWVAEDFCNVATALMFQNKLTVQIDTVGLARSLGMDEFEVEEAWDYWKQRIDRMRNGTMVKRPWYVYLYTQKFFGLSNQEMVQYFGSEQSKEE